MVERTLVEVGAIIAASKSGVIEVAGYAQVGKIML